MICLRVFIGGISGEPLKGGRVVGGGRGEKGGGGGKGGEGGSAADGCSPVYRVSQGWFDITPTAREN